MSSLPPILLLTWRRPNTLRQVINAIRPLAPCTIYVSCDGPDLRRPGELEQVEAVRNVIATEIDWPCNIEKLYSDTNLGCRLGVSRAINWFFNNVEEGIILEDDCVPHPDFFAYCSTLLERYRYDTRIWCISGSNFQNGIWRGDSSYYFSRYNHCWGWATWRRCWQHYDGNLAFWPDLRDSTLLSSIFDNSNEKAYWSNLWSKLSDFGIPDSWAYRWTFTCIANGGLTALPNRNLVSNVGFGLDATHTTGKVITTSISDGILPISHPSFILRDSLADTYTFSRIFGGKMYRFPFSLLRFPMRFLSSVYSWLKMLKS